MTVLKIGCKGQGVLNVQCALAAKGIDPGGLDGLFGRQTAAAVTTFQKQNGLQPANGEVDDATAAALNVQDTTATCLVPELTAQMVAPMFPGTPIENIEANLPHLINALVQRELGNRQMILMALATIHAESHSFLPVGEAVNKAGKYPNTSPEGHDFDLYDHRPDIGNLKAPDGANFRGRGFIQLTGKSNYQIHGQKIGLGGQLIENPLLAHDPAIAAKLMVSFLEAKQSDIRNALAKVPPDLSAARAVVNPGLNGLDRFTEAYNIGLKVIPEQISLASSATNASS